MKTIGYGFAYHLQCIGLDIMVVFGVCASIVNIGIRETQPIIGKLFERSENEMMTRDQIEVLKKASTYSYLSTMELKRMFDTLSSALEVVEASKEFSNSFKELFNRELYREIPSHLKTDALAKSLELRKALKPFTSPEEGKL